MESFCGITCPIQKGISLSATKEERGLFRQAGRVRFGLPAHLKKMFRKETALAVLLGTLVFAIVAYKGLFVEGEATGGAMPGLHPTTEELPEAFLAAYPLKETSESHVAATVARGPVSVRKAAAKAGCRIPAGYVYWKTIRAKVTAYDPSRISCGKFADGKTSIGQSAWVLDGVAADPRAIPYGTYVVIPGVGTRHVDDTGSAMRRSWSRNRRFHLDLRVTYPYQARRWGVKYLDVELYRKAS